MRQNKPNISFWNKCFGALLFLALGTSAHASDTCTPAEQGARGAVQGMNAISPSMLASMSNPNAIMNGGIASGSKGGQLAAKAAACKAAAAKCIQTCQQQIQKGLQLMQNPPTMSLGKTMVQTGQKGKAKCEGEHMPKCQKGEEQAQSDQQHQQQAQQAQPSAQPGQQAPQQQASNEPEEQESEEECDIDEVKKGGKCVNKEEQVASEDCPPGLSQTGTSEDGRAICGCPEGQVLADSQQPNSSQEGTANPNEEEDDSTQYACVDKEVDPKDDPSGSGLNAGSNSRDLDRDPEVLGDEFVSSVPKSLVDSSLLSGGGASSGAYQWRGLESRGSDPRAPANAKTADGEQATFKNVDVGVAGGGSGSGGLPAPPPIGDEDDPVLMPKFGKKVKKSKKAKVIIQQPTHYMPTLEEAVQDLLDHKGGWSNPHERVDHIVTLIKARIDSGDIKVLCKIPLHIKELQLGITYAQLKAKELEAYFEKKLLPLGGRIGLDMVCNQSLAEN